MKKMIYKIFEFLRNILFPPKCVFCERILEPNQHLRVCGNCGDDIEFCTDSVCCEKCGKPILGFGKKKLCYFCLNRGTKYVDRIVSVFIYEGRVKDSVVKFKTHGYRGHGEVFARSVLAEILQEYHGIEFDFVCGVPPHHKKKSGSDQVRILCKRIARQLKIPYETNLFRRLRKTVKQSELGFENRLENMRNSLKVKEDTRIYGATVLLIDDVCTTRATIMECARALKEGGAKHVYAATVATVKNNEKI